VYTINVREFQSLGNHTWRDFVGRAAKRLNGPGAKGCGDVSIKQSMSDWYQTTSLKHAVDLAIKGWPEGAKHIADKLDSIPATHEVLPDWNMDVAGVICNVPAYIAGEPECMWHMSDCKRDERRLSIVVSGVYSGMISAGAAQKYATAIAAVIRSLEAEGINPAVYMINSTTRRGNGGTGAYSISVREFGEPLDIARIAFAFHPSFLRRIQFAWQEMTSEAIELGMGYNSYGSVGLLSKDVVHKLLGDIGYVALIPDLNKIYKQSADDMIRTVHESVNDTLRSMK